jgi:hypothetical protein
LNFPRYKTQFLTLNDAILKKLLNTSMVFQDKKLLKGYLKFKRRKNAWNLNGEKMSGIFTEKNAWNFHRGKIQVFSQRKNEWNLNGEKTRGI